MEFRASVVLGGRTATGIQVPDDVVAAFAAGQRPPVLVTVRGHSYRTTVARMGGAYWVPLAAEHRTAAGLAAGEEVDVSIELDSAPRDVAVPDDLAAAFDDEARSAFEALAYSHRREWVRWIEEAKRPETRADRVERTVASLRAGRRSR